MNEFRHSFPPLYRDSAASHGGSSWILVCTRFVPYVAGVNGQWRLHCNSYLVSVQSPTIYVCMPIDWLVGVQITCNAMMPVDGHEPMMAKLAKITLDCVVHLGGFAMGAYFLK